MQTLDFLDGAAVSLVDAAIIVPSFPVISDVGIHREHSYRMSGILKEETKQGKENGMIVGKVGHFSRSTNCHHKHSNIY